MDITQELLSWLQERFWYANGTTPTSKIKRLVENHSDGPTVIECTCELLTIMPSIFAFF